MPKNKTIAISLINYNKIKKFGLAGDSFNLAISRLLKTADTSAGSVLG
jgi:hypothetical protein